MACNDDAEDGVAAPTTMTSTGATTTTEPAAEPSCSFEPDGADTQQSEGEGGPLFIDSIVHAELEHACAEEVAFRVEEPESGSRVAYEVGYSSGPFEDPSGRAATVKGEAFLRVVLLNATTVDLSGNEPRETMTFQGQPTEGAAVRDIVKVSDFEGVSEWVIGVDARRPFTAEYDADSREFLVTISTA